MTARKWWKNPIFTFLFSTPTNVEVENTEITFGEQYLRLSCFRSDFHFLGWLREENRIHYQLSFYFSHFGVKFFMKIWNGFKNFEISKISRTSFEKKLHLVMHSCKNARNYHKAKLWMEYESVLYRIMFDVCNNLTCLYNLMWF